MSRNNEFIVSAPAMHAARTLLKNFRFESTGTIEPTERNIAIIVDVCTQIFRVEAALDNMVQRVPWLDKRSLGQNLDQLREAVRAIELVRNRMPSYGRTLGEKYNL